MSTAIEDDEVSVLPRRAARENPVEILMRIATAARLCRSREGGLCVEFPSGEQSDIAELQSSKFRDWLFDGYFDREGRSPSGWAVRRALSRLEARASGDTGLPSVFVRVGGQRGSAPDGAAIYLDLGNADGCAIRIQRGSWSVVDRPAVRFKRPEGQLPFPVPSREGSIDLLRPYVNLSEPDFRLLVVWLTAALRPAGPYPILTLSGEQGSGKSTLTKLVRLLIDPHVSAVLTQPRNTRELVSTAVNRWLLAYDNLSAIPEWFSNSLCRLADGGGFLEKARRAGEQARVVHVQRPVVLNGINDLVRRGDLGDRCVFLRLPPVQTSRRRSEQEYWSSFQYDHPRILGGLLDAVASGLRVLPSLQLTAVPRMADFAYWGEAAGRGMDWAAGIFLTIYRDNLREASERALEDSAVGAAALDLGRGLRRWSGNAVELHAVLSRLVGKEVAASARWPKTVSALSKELRRISTWLRTHGLSVSVEKKRSQNVITLTADDTPEKGLADTPPLAHMRSVVEPAAGTKRREVRFR
jgi:hypothetical protein